MTNKRYNKKRKGGESPMDISTEDQNAEDETRMDISTEDQDVIAQNPDQVADDETSDSFDENLLANDDEIQAEDNNPNPNNPYDVDGGKKSKSRRNKKCKKCGKKSKKNCKKGGKKSRKNCKKGGKKSRKSRR